VSGPFAHSTIAWKLVTYQYALLIVLRRCWTERRWRNARCRNTDGNTWAFVDDANVLSTGDTVGNTSRYSTIDFANGDDIRGVIPAFAVMTAADAPTAVKLWSKSALF
jgi:hypothetical protein